MGYTRVFIPPIKLKTTCGGFYIRTKTSIGCTSHTRKVSVSSLIVKLNICPYIKEIYLFHCSDTVKARS
jgi:hypothetical protein